MKQYSFLAEDYYKITHTSTYRNKNQANRYKTTGGLIGAGLGGYGGAKLSDLLSGKKERVKIKEIILRSSTPEECIENLRQLNTNKAIKYASIMQGLVNNPNWREEILKKINLKNILGTAGGALAGGAIGASIGSKIGLDATPLHTVTRSRTIYY